LKSVAPKAKRTLDQLLDGDDKELAYKAVVITLAYNFGAPLNRQEVSGPDGKAVQITSGLPPLDDAELARRAALILERGQRKETGSAGDSVAPTDAGARARQRISEAEAAEQRAIALNDKLVEHNGFIDRRLAEVEHREHEARRREQSIDDAEAQLAERQSALDERAAALATQRDAALGAAIDGMLDEDFRDRILPFDRKAARAYAAIAAERRAAGRPISQFDCQIAAIARAHGASVATRNIDDYEGCGVAVIDPWD
jgi:predicted nucleic acid-binding protein